MASRLADIMPEIGPYISVVVTARNDDHGGGLLRRMQTFVNGWIGQCQKHGLVSELIVVEWNPSEDRPPLMDALQWPADTRPCQVRFIQVPREIHRRYQYGEVMALYQMIAKNVGIRRARGRFVLATNIDIIFSDELVRYLAEARLEPGRMYRIDRHDVMNDVPVDGSVDDQLAYCKTHLIRVNAREGTFNLTPDGLPALSEQDIADHDSGIRFGAGWYGVERDSMQQVFRWMNTDAEIGVSLPGDPPSPLIFHLEPGPSAGSEPLRLQAVDSAGKILAETEVRGPAKIEVKLSFDGETVRSFRLHVAAGGGRPVPHDSRLLNLRVYRCEWEASPAGAARRPAAPLIRRKMRAPGLWIKFMYLVNRMAADGPHVDLALRVPDGFRRLARFYVGVGGLTGVLKGGLRRYRQLPRDRVGSNEEWPHEMNGSSVENPVLLHTNACGDFTLMARENWADLRAYPEFDLHSFNLDSLLCYAAHHGGIKEEIWRDPLRIYHIEHATGSGWTPEGQAQLFGRLHAKGIGWLDYRELVAWAGQMRWLNSPMIFNRENWGLANLELKETAPSTKSSANAAS